MHQDITKQLLSHPLYHLCIDCRVFSLDGSHRLTTLACQASNPVFAVANRDPQPRWEHLENRHPILIADAPYQHVILLSWRCENEQ